MKQQQQQTQEQQQVQQIRQEQQEQQEQPSKKKKRWIKVCQLFSLEEYACRSKLARVSVPRCSAPVARTSFITPEVQPPLSTPPHLLDS